MTLTIPLSSAPPLPFSQSTSPYPLPPPSDAEDYDLELRQIHGRGIGLGLGLGQPGSAHTSNPSLGSLGNPHLHPLAGAFPPGGLDGDHGGGGAAAVHYEVDPPPSPSLTPRHHPSPNTPLP